MHRRHGALSAHEVLLLQEQSIPAEFDDIPTGRLPKMPGRARRGARRALAAGALLATTAGALLYGVEPIADMLRAPTGQEERIETAVRDAFGTTDTVRCLSEKDLENRPTGLVPRERARAKAWILGYPLVWIGQEDCNALTEFAHYPDGDPNIASNDPKQGLLQKAASAAGVLTHELGHANKGILNEGKANCYAGQESYRILVALGARSTFALRQYTAEEERHNVADVVGRSGSPGGHPEYALPENCMLP